MPVLKPISGHTGLAAAQEYLERGGRALAHDYINLDAPEEGIEGPLPEYGPFDWARVMDETRAELGNDRAWGSRRARTYKHYIISPDPRDGVDLETLRSLALEWAERHFGEHEVAIVYHDDNEHRIPHAHVIVNNTNLETGGRLRDPDPRALKRSLQSLAGARGLSRFADEPPARDARGRTVHPKSAPGRRVSLGRAERDLRARGEYSWVADIRARIDVARGISDSPDAFRHTLRAMGISVRESASRKGDWVYALADAPSRQVTGSRLGATYTRSHIARELSSGTASPLLRGGAEIRSAARSAVEVGDLRELTHLAEAVRTVSQGGFKSISGLDAAIARVRQDGRHPATLERLMRVRAFCEERGMLPKLPPKERPLSHRDYERRLDRLMLRDRQVRHGGHDQHHQHHQSASEPSRGRSR